MQRDVQITFQGIDHSDAVASRIRSKVSDLERLNDHITSCRVTVASPHHRHHKGNLYAVRIDLQLPDHTIIVDKHPSDNHSHEDVYVAVRDAFAAAERQLDDYTQKIRARKGPNAHRRG